MSSRFRSVVDIWHICDIIKNMDYEGRICRPAFEKGAFKLPISIGCSYNECKFCGLFKNLKFKIIDDEIEVDIDSFHDYIPFRVKGHLPKDKEKLIRLIDERINYGREK